MPAFRIIPCLDVRAGRVVKGVQFANHRDVGDIVEHALYYRDHGADELVFYDITASAERRGIDLAWVNRVARVIDIPFAVAGGIATRDAAAAVLDAGADKLSINSPALADPDLIDALARDFGSQCVVLGLDSFRDDGGTYRVKQYTGSEATSRDAGRESIAWAREATERGAGEIVLNCMKRDGMQGGYDCDHIAAVVAAVDVPVIASGGAGKAGHFADAHAAGASGGLAASIFHDRRVAIPDLKQDLAARGIEIRPYDRP